MHEWRAAMDHCYMTSNRHTHTHRITGGREERGGEFATYWPQTQQLAMFIYNIKTLNKLSLWLDTWGENMGHKDRKVYRKRKTPATPFFIFCHLGSKNCQTKCSDTKTVVCSLIYIPTYINRHDKKKKPGRHCVGGGFVGQWPWPLYSPPSHWGPPISRQLGALTGCTGALNYNNNPISC